MLFERDQDLEALSERLAEAEAGRGHVVFVVGEAGIGKTSLIREFASQAAERVRVRLAACEDLSTPEALVLLHDLGLASSDHSPIAERSLVELFTQALDAL